MGAQVLAESNIFNSVKDAIATNLYSKEAGFAADVNNVKNGNTTISITQTCSYTPDYAYK